MTREQAADEFAAAINDRNFTDPAVIKRVDDAKAALAPYLVGGKVPPDLVDRIKGVLQHAG